MDEADDSEKEGVGCRCGCTGEMLGEPLDSDDRSDDEEWMDCSWLDRVSVRCGWEQG